MAELTVLEEKIAEVLGLAMAAQDTTGKVGHWSVVGTLHATP